jgi:Transposase zinc-ribbon domain
MRWRVPGTEAGAYELFELVRWGAAPVPCPHCGVAGKAAFLRPRGAAARLTRTGAPTERRVWKCGACRRQFSVLSGTVFEGTRISLRAWLSVLAERAAGTAGGAAGGMAELATRCGLSRGAARHVLRRLELALGAEAASAADALAALLRLPSAEAARIRERTPPRVRPRPQAGPTADYGRG